MKKLTILFFSLLVIVLTGCDGQPVCIEGSTQPGTTPCSDKGYYLQVCENGTWIDDVNICEDSTDICDTDKTCVNGPWIDGGDCTCDLLLSNYGLGIGQLEYATAEPRSYDWYLDQYKTGIHSSSNCGSVSTSMAIKWADEYFTVDILKARKRYRPLGGAWYTTDVMYYLEDHNISYYLFEINGDKELLKQVLDTGNIFIFCIDVSKLSYNSNKSQHVGRFYKNVNGHFIVAKGYTIIDDILYFEVYDPLSMNARYSNSSQLKGKNRYYKWERELSDAIASYWNYAIAVEAKPGGTVFGFYKEVNGNIVNPGDIVHVPGGSYK